MRFTAVLLALVGVAAIYDPLTPTGAEIIDGEFIVVLHPTVQMESHMTLMASLVNETNTMHTYSIGSFQGYAVKMSKSEAKTLATHKDVKYVEPNMVARALQTCNNFPAPHSWGLARTVRTGPVNAPGSTPIASAPYELNSRSTGAGIDVHVIDTGVYCVNNDFQGRGAATCNTEFDATGEGLFDGNGHGTHVASTAAGQRYGLAKSANIIGVKVLGSNGSGSFAGVISGINFSARAAAGGRRVVGNMSLGGGFNAGVNDATNAAFAAGLVMAVAAGNSNNNACNSSPASAADAFTVMSTANNDSRSTFSSFGPCCQIFAPGTGITAAWINAPDRTNTISGTSMASPHIAGIAAKIWSSNTALTNRGVQEAMVRFASPNNGLVTNPGTGSPNVLGLHTCANGNSF